MARRVVLHIGLMKSGTTFIQGRLGPNRERLAAQGVLYPGPTWQRQLRAVADLMHHDGRVPGSWESLVEEVDAFDGTALVSMEYLAMAGDRAIGIIGETFGATELRIVVGVRDLGRSVPAMWQEAVKNRSTVTFGDYVAAIKNGGDPGRRFWRQQHSARIVNRWASQLGSDRLYVVTVPPRGAPRELLWQRFIGVAGIADEPDWDGVERPNESMGAAFALLMRQLNELTTDLPVDDYKKRFKATANLLLSEATPPGSGRRPGDGPIGFAVPRWLRQESSRIVEGLAASGAHIVGDLADLTPVDVPGVDPAKVSTQAQLDAAVVALERVLRRARGIRRHE